MDDLELHATYLALIRRELRLPPGADALLALESRLAPPDKRARPPARAPAIARLAKALRRLCAHKTPASGIEQFMEDLRFLRLFEDGPQPWSDDALDKLLSDVRAPAPRRAKPADAKRPGADETTPGRDAAQVIPFPAKRARARPRTRGDA